MKLHHMAPKSGGKRHNFALTSDERWNLELPTILAGTGSELNSMYWNGLVFGIDIDISVKSLLCIYKHLKHRESTLVSSRCFRQSIVCK